MRLPDDIAHSILAGGSLGFGCDPNRMVRRWKASTNGIYPPIGYLEWSVLEVGNGDTYGYYWPVGNEDQEPIVCTTEHDAFRVVPLASTLAGCLRLMYATRKRMQMRSGRSRRRLASTQVVLSGVRPNNAATPAEAPAALDPRSPQLLLAVARGALHTGDLTHGERSVALALDLLPEYGEAAFVLSQLYCRQQRFSQAAQALVDAISSPLCFGGYALP